MSLSDHSALPPVHSITEISDMAAAYGLGQVRFHAQTAPAGDDLPMDKVLLSVSFRSPGAERGFASVEREMDPREARAFAAEIVRSCEIVEREQREESKKKRAREASGKDDPLEILAASGHDDGEIDDEGIVQVESVKPAAKLDVGDRVRIVDGDYCNGELGWFEGADDVTGALIVHPDSYPVGDSPLRLDSVETMEGERVWAHEWKDPEEDKTGEAEEGEASGGEKNPSMGLPADYCSCGFENLELCKPQNCYLRDEAFGKKWGF